MPSVRSIVLWALPLVSLGFAAPHPEADAFDAEVIAEREDVLKQLPGDSLKVAIETNLQPKYRDGVFEDGHAAMPAVYSDDPDLASKLLNLAKSDAIVKEYLRKRQNDNTTTSVATTSPIAITDSTTTAVTITTETTVVTTPSTSPTTEDRPTSEAPATPTSTIEASSPITEPTVTGGDEPVSITQTGVLVPIEVSTTAEDGSVVVSTTDAFQTEAPTSVPVAVTTTNDQGEIITTSTMAPAAIITSTNDRGSVITTASPIPDVAVAPGGGIVTSAPMMVTTTDAEGGMVVLSRPTPGGVYTTTDAGGSVAVVTYTPRRGTVSQIRLQTTTLPNGQRSTITSFAVVGGATAAASEASASAPPSGTPDLQNGAATPSSWCAAEIAILAGAAIGVAGMIL